MRDVRVCGREGPILTRPAVMNKAGGHQQATSSLGTVPMGNMGTCGKNHITEPCHTQCQGFRTGLSMLLPG